MGESIICSRRGLGLDSTTDNYPHQMGPGKRGSDLLCGKVGPRDENSAVDAGEDARGGSSSDAGRVCETDRSDVFD